MSLPTFGFRRRRVEAAAALDVNRRLMDAREAERRQMARALHDDIAQRIVLVGMEVERLKAAVFDSPDALRQVTAIHDTLTAIGCDIDGLSRRLHSSTLDRLGLAAAARHYCTELSTRHHVAIDYVDANVPADLSRQSALALFRVLQDALWNAVRHADARRCVVTLLATADDITLGVADDGLGFDVASRTSGDSRDLASMHERMRLVNGEVSVESSPGQGTRVRARAPVALKSG